jgi:predicted Fe-Mo cluster-binding NifX family protein
MHGGRISEHFGKCEEIMIAEIEAGEVKSREVLPAPPHDCAALPNLFVQKGVGSVIAGGMGAGAIQNLEHAGVRVYAGVQGSPEDALGRFISGTLTAGVAACGGGHDDGCAH